MVWIARGALVAGTPPDLLPRVAESEMQGQQVILEGFFIDVFAYPNEEAAIPLTNVSLSEARSLCAERGKRLCSELEWERACKGPNNTVYEYGDRYRPEVCGTGQDAKLLPSGLRYGCRSEFGVRDLHGSVWEWTDSPWARGGTPDQIAIRGGNATSGEVVGRCANGEASSSNFKSPSLGFRCCQGERNTAEVVLHVERGPALERHNHVAPQLAESIGAALPRTLTDAISGKGPLVVLRAWDWRPVGNEELVIAGGCAGTIVGRSCGAVIARKLPGKLVVLDWAPSGNVIPALKIERDARDLWVYGSERKTHFRRLVAYRWGNLQIGEIQRNPRGWVQDQ
jgi:hypothetical protein